MKVVKILAFSMLAFFVATINSKAYKTQLDYNYQVKDFQNFKQYVGTFPESSSIGKKANAMLDENGYLRVPSMCKYSYEKSCICYSSDKTKYSLDPLDTSSCFCFNYPLYKNGNYASLYVPVDGGISVLVNTHSSSEFQVDKITGSYKYIDADLFDTDTNSFTEKLEKSIKKVASSWFDTDFAIGDVGQLKDFADYGYCPSGIVVNPVDGNDSSTNHKGVVIIGKYGIGIPDSFDGLIDFAVLYAKHTSGALSSSDIEKIPYIYFNDVFNVTSQGSNAFSQQDKQYIDNVIYDLNNSVNYSDEDLTFCDFSKDGNNTYENISKALDFAIYTDRSYVQSSFKTHLFLAKLLENNNYNALAEAVSNNLGTGSKCYEKFGTYENGVKFEDLYDKANQYLKNTTIDPEKNTIKDCKTLLGDPNNSEDVAYYLQKALNFIKILGPILIIVLSVYDYVKAIPSGDKEILSKVNKKSAIRISAGIALFFAPILVKALFTLFGLYSDGDCGIG